ncbi:hypothetical protein [Pseudemcibacter aquimaris]|uniref:hypothetical protein n=1 Tax=Pseudemcibacter aquimaris TaxID=2857064 RepID=UPI002011F041|nr:hypothetical protein [Pseudemcibacter aquimaris]MCC3861431.1 hypothetical protein [Pseudemcibacter aquimaris]WDU58200.1 hypothetical protein KW060_13490 [Pseudemcibacter aquimaris]
MASYNVTLKSDVKLGTFYWVTTVNADSEEEAVTAAEHKFLEQLGSEAEWDFTDYDAEKL